MSRGGLRLPAWMGWSLGGLGVLLASAALGLGLLPLFIDGDSFRQPLEHLLTSTLKRRVVLGQVSLQTLGGLGLKAGPVTVTTLGGTRELTAQNILVEVNLPALLAQRIEMRRIRVEQGQLWLNRDPTGRWNFSDLAQPPAGPDAGYTGPALSFVNTTVNLSTKPTQLARKVQVTGFDLDLEPRDPFTLNLRLKGNLPEHASLQATGELRLPQAHQPWDGTVHLKAQNLHPEQITPYFADRVQGLKGIFDLDLEGQLGQQPRLAGTVHARRLDWTWPAVWGPKPWMAQDLTVDTALVLQAQHLRVERLKLTTAGLEAALSGTLPRNWTQPQATLELALNTGLLDPFQARQNLPLGVLPAAVRPWITQSKGAGKLRADLMFRGSALQPTATGIIEFQDFTFRHPRLDRPLERLQGKATLTPTTLELADLRIGPKDSEATINGQVGRTGPGKLALKVTSSTIKLAPLAPWVGPGGVGIGGVGSLDLSVAGTLAAPQVLGKVSLNGATWQPPGAAQPLRDLRGALLLESGRLLLQDLQGNLGRSSFQTAGAIEGYGTLTIRPRISFKSMALDLEAARSFLATEALGGGLGRAFRQTFRTLKGTSAVDLQIQGTQASGRIEFQGAELGLSALAQPLEEVRGAVTVGREGTTLQGLRTNLAGSPLMLAGSVSPSGALKIKGQGTLKFPQVLALFPAQQAIKAKGNVPAQFTVAGTTKQWTLGGDLDLGQLTELTINNTLSLTPARRLEIRGSYTSNTLTLADTRMEFRGLTLVLGGTVSQPGTLAQRFALQVRTLQPLPLATLTSFAPADLGATAGQAGLDLTLTGPAPNWRATLKLSGVKIPGLLGGIDRLGGPVTLEGNRVSTSGLTFQTAEGQGQVQGTIPDLRNPKVTFEARFAQLNLDRLLQNTSTGGGAGKGTDKLGTFEGQGRVTIGRGTLGRLAFERLSTQVRLDRGTWTLDDLSLATAGGRMTGSIRTEVRSRTTSGTLSLRDAQADLLARQLLSFPTGQVYGSTDLDLDFRGTGSDPNQFLDSLSGRGSLTITKGRLASLDFLGTLLGATEGFSQGSGFSIDTLLGAVSRLNTGRFDRLGGDFTLREGTASTDNFTYEGTSLRMEARGDLRLVDRDARLEVRGVLAQNAGGGRGGDLLRGLLSNVLPSAPAQPRNFSFSVDGPVNQVSSVRNLRWN